MATAPDAFKAIENRNIKAFRRAVAGRGGALRTRDGRSALQYAMVMRADDIALEMIDGGVEVRPEEADLTWAVLVRRPDLVRRFIGLGADLNVRSGMGTPLSIAAAPPASMAPGSDEDLLAIMRLLIEAGADVNVGGSMGSPLSGAVAKGRRDAARLLLEAGARVEKEGVAELVELAKANGDAELAEMMRAAADARRKRPTAKAPPAFERSADPDVAKLESLCGTKAGVLEGVDGAVTLHVDSRREFDLAKVQATFLKRGRFVFATDGKGRRVAMMRTRDPYEAIAAMGTNGDNHEVTNAEIIRWLREVGGTEPFTITGIGFDFVMGRFRGKVKDPAGLARRMYAICPDVVNQGTESVRGLEGLLRKSREFFLWWD